jgi:hypothetical protein
MGGIVLAIRDIYLSGDGNDALDGRTWANRVRTFRRARQIASGILAPDQVSFVIGQFNMARAAQFNQQLGKGIGDTFGDVPDGWLMRAQNPNLPWHFTDLDVLNQSADFVQVFRNGTTYNAATANCLNVTNNNGVPSGQATGIWVTTRDVADANKPLYRVARVWRGGNPLTIDSVTAFPSAYDPYNEIWEARRFETLGQDETHIWTQLTPTELDLTQGWWPAQADNPLPSAPPPDDGRLFVFCPKGNPATVWGGVTVLTQRSAGAGVVLELGFLTIQQSAGWHVDETIRAIGGGIGAFKIRGGCANGRFEARVDVMTPHFPVVDLNPHRKFDDPNFLFDTFTALEVSPRWDMRVVGKPYFEIDPKHGTGQSDALRIAGTARVNGLLVRGRTSSSAAELCYVRDPVHNAIHLDGQSLENMTVERDFSVYLGGSQYQRAFGGGGDASAFRNITLGGRVYGQRAPSQIWGGSNVQIVGLEFHYGGQLIPASPDNVARYPSRFSNEDREFTNVHPDGKNRDAAGLVVSVRGTLEVRDCVFDAVHGPAIQLCSIDGSSVRQRQSGDSCIVENCTFVNSAVPGSQRTAVFVDDRGDAGGGVHLINNAAVGYPAGAGGQWTDDGFNRDPIRLEDMHLTGPMVAENVGWQRLAFANCYG